MSTPRDDVDTETIIKTCEHASRKIEAEVDSMRMRAVHLLRAQACLEAAAQRLRELTPTDGSPAEEEE